MEILGRQVEIGVGVEAVRGTPIVDADRWLKKVVANILPRAEKARDTAMRGRLEEADGARITQKWIDGDLEGIVHADAIGYMLYNLYGEVDSQLITGSVYSHIFTLAQELTHPTLTLFAKDGSTAQAKFAGGVVKTLEISATVDEYVRFTTAFEARTSSADSSTPAYEREYDFIGRDVSIKLADTEEGLTTAPAQKVKNATIRYDSGAIRDHLLGDRAPANILNGRFMLEVEITRNYEDTVLRDMHQSDAAKYVEVTIAGEADLGGSNPPSIVLLLNKAQVTAWDRSGASDDLVTETATLSAFYNETDEQQSQLELTNVTPAYAVGS
jgi:hypothetical protein